MENVTAYPLTWPDNIKRSQRRQSSKFKSTLNSALNNVNDSLRRFAADSSKKLESVVISSNVTLGSNRPEDPGVAVWFVWDGMQVCIAVDRYPKVEDNLQAIHHIIEARRTELRHGGLEIVRATFTGFQALPAPGKAEGAEWWNVLGISQNASIAQINEAYRKKAKQLHTDTAGGNDAAMKQLNVARDSAINERKEQ